MQININKNDVVHFVGIGGIGMSGIALIMKSLVSNIADGIEDNLESVNIAEIKNHDIIINVSKSEWKGGLEKALEYYIEGEEYEQCSKVRDLINKL